MAILVQQKTAKEVFLDLLDKNRLMPDLAIEREADILLSRVRFALANSDISEESKDNVIKNFGYRGSIECTLPIKFFRELSHPDNRNLLLAALALEVERARGNPEQVGLVRCISNLSFLGKAFDKATILLPSVDVATQLCFPHSEEAQGLRQDAKNMDLSLA